MTLSDMAREIERRRPKSIHETIDVGNETLLVFGGDGYDDAPPIALHPSVAAAILRDAMVQAMVSSGCRLNFYNDLLGVDMKDWSDRRMFKGEPTERIFAAFCAAYPEAKP